MNLNVTRVSIIFAAVLIGSFSLLAYADFTRVPNHLFLASEEACPVNFEEGITSYLASSEQIRFQAARLLVNAESESFVSGKPPSSIEKIFDWHRAKRLSSTKYARSLVMLLCSGPILEINGQRLAGIPTVASVIFDKQPADLSEQEIKLASCAVVAPDGGERQYVHESQGAERIASLKRVCKGI